MRSLKANADPNCIQPPMILRNGIAPLQFAIMTHDKLFKEFMRRFLGDFMRLFFPEESAELDFSTVEFVEQEFNINLPDIGSQAADVIARVKTRDGKKTRTIILHIEIEAYMDSWRVIGRRLLDYYVLIRLRENEDVLPILLILKRGGSQARWRHYKEELFGHTLIQFKYGQIGLPKLSVSEDFMSSNAVAAALSVLMNRGEMSPWELKFKSLSVIAKDDINEGDRHFLMSMVERYMPDQELPTPHEVMDMTYADNVQELRETAFTLAWDEAMALGQQVGMEKGREKGREEGQLQGQQITLLDQMQVKFGFVPESIVQRLSQIADDEKLKQIGRAILVADSLEALPYLQNDDS